MIVRSTSLVLAATVLVLVGCSDDSPSPRTEPARTTGSDFVVAGDAPFPVIAGSREQGGAFAALRGRLELDNGCLVVVTANQRVTPVFLDGDSPEWDVDAEQLLLAEQTYPIDGEVDFGGGEVPRAALRPAVVPRPCRDRAVYFIVSSTG